MKLETDRLVLRYFNETDWKDIHEYLSQEATVAYEPYDVMDEEACKDTAKYRASNHDFIAVCLKDSDKVIGNLYFHRKDPCQFDTWELGYVFNANFTGKGYATEACRGLINHAFKDMSTHRIMARCNILNQASWLLLERLGFRREGCFRQVAFFKDKPDGSHDWHDAYEYAMLASDWLS